MAKPNKAKDAQYKQDLNKAVNKGRSERALGYSHTIDVVDAKYQLVKKYPGRKVDNDFTAAMQKPPAKAKPAPKPAPKKGRGK